ncbi:hypothetical protein ACRCF9_16310 [Pseudomonas canadensis]|uniref:hypothetical protein n=1 Tax=Pseudomonas TaxID=286 RepID=UPI003D6A4A32
MFSAVSTQPVVASIPSSSQEPADALSRQLHRSLERLPPGSRPLQRDARWVADLVLEKLAPLASFHRDRAAIEALYQKLSTSEPNLEVSVEELSDYYALFKKAEHELRRHRTDNTPNIEADYTLCRALKWQFRAAVSDVRHQRLTQQLLPALAYVRNGGERSNHRQIGYNYALDPMLQNSTGPQLTVDSRLEISADQRVKSTRAISLKAQLKSSTDEQFQTRSQLGIGYVSSNEYANLEQYADARSHSVRTSLSESLRRTVKHLPNLLRDSHSLQRHLAYSALSQPYVRDTLSSAGLTDVELPSVGNTSQPLITERGITLLASNKVTVDVFDTLKINTTFKPTLQHTHRHRTLDILGLYETAPELAQLRLASHKHYNDDPVTLLTDIKSHIATSSKQFTQRICTPVPAFKFSTAPHSRNKQAQSLLERYVLLKTQSRLDEQQGKEIRTLIQHNRAHLRPDALNVHKLTARAQILSFSAGIMASSQTETGKGISIEVSHRKLDDPHLSGDYLTIDIAPLKSREIVKKMLRQVLSFIGEQTFDWETLIRSISESLLDPVRPSATQVLVKIKHGQPVMLYTRHTVVKNRDLELPRPFAQISGIEAQSLRARQTLRNEQLGCESLDHVLPIARRYLENPDERPGWDDYVEQHTDDFHTLLDTLGGQAHGTMLTAEIDALKRISPALTRAADAVIQEAHTALEAPTRANRASAQAAFNHLLREYMPHYGAKVREAWTLS